MKKADYTLLALEIEQQMRLARGTLSDTACMPRDYAVALGALTCCKNIAHQFAAHAHVNNAEFLKACGIEP